MHRLTASAWKTKQTRSVWRLEQWSPYYLYTTTQAVPELKTSTHCLANPCSWRGSCLSVLSDTFWWKSIKTWDDVSERACKTLREEYWMLSQGPLWLTMFDSGSGSSLYLSLSNQSELPWPCLNLRPVMCRKKCKCILTPSQIKCHRVSLGPNVQQPFTHGLDMTIDPSLLCHRCLIIVFVDFPSGLWTIHCRESLTPKMWKIFSKSNFKHIYKFLNMSLLYCLV